MKRLASISFISWVCVDSSVASADEKKAVANKSRVVELWPGQPPDEIGKIGAEYVRTQLARRPAGQAAGQ